VIGGPSRCRFEVFVRYNLGDVAALRARLVSARGSVVALRGKRGQRAARAGSSTATAQRGLAPGEADD